MVVSCVIEFDNNSSDTYFADQILNGKVILNADKPKKFKAVVVKIAGFANIKWSEKTSSSSTDSKGKTTYIPSTYYTGREDYLAKTICILGADKGQSEVTIEAGKHVYSFDCHIPPHCPTSFEGRFGHIRYVVQVILTRSWKSDLEFRKGFTVLTIKELNYEPNLLLQPVHTSAQKTVNSWPNKSAPLQLDLDLLQSGFVPGQQIPISLLVTNDSHIPVEEIHVTLCMIVFYYSQKPLRTTKRERIPLSQIKSVGVQRNCKKLFNYELQVPATPPSNSFGCSILEIAYEILVQAKLKGVRVDHVICAPVIIDQVPRKNEILQQSVMTSSEMNTKMQEKSQRNETFLKNDVNTTNSALPTYEEATLPTGGKICFEENHYNNENILMPKNSYFEGSNSLNLIDKENDKV